MSAAGLDGRLEQAVLLAGRQDEGGVLRVDHNTGGPSAALFPVGHNGGAHALLMVRGAARLDSGGRAAHVARALVDHQPGRRSVHALYYALAVRRCAPSSCSLPSPGPGPVLSCPPPFSLTVLTERHSFATCQPPRLQSIHSGSANLLH